MWRGRWGHVWGRPLSDHWYPWWVYPVPKLRFLALCHPQYHVWLDRRNTGRPSGVGYFPRTQGLWRTRLFIWERGGIWHCAQREMVNHMLSFPDLVMNGSLSSWDIASDEIFVPTGVVGNHVLFARCFGFKTDSEKKSGGIHKIGPEPFYLQFHWNLAKGKPSRYLFYWQ